MGPVWGGLAVAGSIAWLIKDIFGIYDKKSHEQFDIEAKKARDDAKRQIGTRVDIENRARKIRSNAAEDISRVMGPEFDSINTPPIAQQLFDGAGAGAPSMPADDPFSFATDPASKPMSGSGMTPQGMDVMRQLEKMIGTPVLANRLHDEAVAAGGRASIFDSLGIPMPFFDPVSA